MSPKLVHAGIHVTMQIHEGVVVEKKAAAAAVDRLLAAGNLMPTEEIASDTHTPSR